MSGKPISELVAQGWEVVQFSSSLGDSGMMEHCFLMRRNREHKIVRVRAKMLGEGVVTGEMEV